MEREYVLKWHSFSSTLQCVFRRLLDNAEFADVTLVTAHCRLPCHKLVLSACSSYFEQVLRQHQHPHPFIILHEVPAAVLRALVTFMYSGEIRLAHDQLHCFLQAAESLKIKGLTENYDGGVKAAAVCDTTPPPLISAAQSPCTSPAGSAVTTTDDDQPVCLTSNKRRAVDLTVSAGHTENGGGGGGSALKRPCVRRATVHSVHVAVAERHAGDGGRQTEEPAHHQRRTQRAHNSTCADHTDSQSTACDLRVVTAASVSTGQNIDNCTVRNTSLSDDVGKTERPDDNRAADSGGQIPDEDDVASRRSQSLEKDMELVFSDPENVEDVKPARDDSVEPTVHKQSALSTSTALSLMNISTADDQNLPWKDPKWTSVLPEDKVLEAMGNMLDVPTLAAKLMKNLFTEEERINSNTTGDHGKQIFDKEKMQLIRSIAVHVSKVSEDDQAACDDLWVRCKMKIDKWNRDLRYARKKKDKDTSSVTSAEAGGPAAGDCDNVSPLSPHTKLPAGD